PAGSRAGRPGRGRSGLSRCRCTVTERRRRLHSWWHSCSPTRAATLPGRRSPLTALHPPSPHGMGCHTQFRGLRLNVPFGSAVAAALSIEYVISAQWASCATVTPPTNPAHYTHESGGPAAAPLLWPSECVSDEMSD